MYSSMYFMYDIKNVQQFSFVKQNIPKIIAHLEKCSEHLNSDTAQLVSAMDESLSFNSINGSTPAKKESHHGINTPPTPQINTTVTVVFPESTPADLNNVGDF